MPDDVGAGPFPDGGEPDEHHNGNHGEADAHSPYEGEGDGFAAVVFDEEFVRSALVHEPTAVERMVAAAQARAESEAGRGHSLSATDRDGEFDGGRQGRDGREGPEWPAEAPNGRYPDDVSDISAYGPYGPYGGALRPYRGAARWHRPIAWVLAVLMGIGMVVLAFTAVYRGASGRTQSPAPPPATTGVDGRPPTAHIGQAPASSAEHGNPAPPVVPPSASADSGPPSAPAVPRTP
ncbi:SCO2584 family spore wall biosynthesis protein [Streptomyces purpurogeneiscleroticus]|uniref:SCO2584 family spore wall biosynthesis protein n=1 Tax=Streptomyces purpurogeneiscleroticus TaxID=68259 RepID=UPI001CBF0196|nr:hypothetical protein [Streptomyces purpurogeneiscleroticus]MBZ4015564.1 hypothetical protein [Streptomyces purpurogeneiscleroticus]